MVSKLELTTRVIKHASAIASGAIGAQGRVSRGGRLQGLKRSNPARAQTHAGLNRVGRIGLAAWAAAPFLVEPFDLAADLAAGIGLGVDVEIPLAGQVERLN